MTETNYIVKAKNNSEVELEGNFNDGYSCDFEFGQKTQEILGREITVDEKITKDGEVKYTNQIYNIQEKENTAENSKYYIISYAELEKRGSLPQPFIEVIEKPEFVHLYFDFDEMKNKCKKL